MMKFVLKKKSRDKIRLAKESSNKRVGANLPRSSASSLTFCLSDQTNAQSPSNVRALPRNTNFLKPEAR
jgi:hypothetical protein